MLLAIIPARFASSRFPGKPLVNILGKSMIQRVCEQVQKCSAVDKFVVATDDQRIFDHVRALNFEAMMTQSTHQSGTDRCAEVAHHFPKAKYIVNVQGDEPFIAPAQIELLANTLIGSPKVKIATLAKKIVEVAQLQNPNIVKVVRGTKGDALYFSRQVLPYVRGLPIERWLEKHDFYRHIGLYGFQRNALLKIAQLPPSPLELVESLEQLRWLENGFPIRLGFTELDSIGIDTPEDLLAIG